MLGSTWQNKAHCWPLADVTRAWACLPRGVGARSLTPRPGPRGLLSPHVAAARWTPRRWVSRGCLAMCLRSLGFGSVGGCEHMLMRSQYPRACVGQQSRAQGDVRAFTKTSALRGEGERMAACRRQEAVGDALSPLAQLPPSRSPIAGPLGGGLTRFLRRPGAPKAGLRAQQFSHRPLLTPRERMGDK